MVIFFAGLVPHTDNPDNAMMEFFFAKGLDSLQDGFVTFSNGIPRDGGWIFLVLGSLFAMYVMYGWWKDVAAESKAGDHTPVVDIGLRYGMIMFIMQEAMFFWVFSIKCVRFGTQMFSKMPLLMRIQWRQAHMRLTRGTCL